MRLTESQVRKLIQEELKIVLNEMSHMGMKPEEEKFGAKEFGKSVALGGGLAAGAAGVNALLMYIQNHPEVSKPIIQLIKALGHSIDALEE
jgi:translation initiation factor IF-2